MGKDSLERIRELRLGSYAAFNSIYFEYSKKLYVFAKSYLKNDIDVEGIVQDVFLKLWMNRETLQDGLSFESYLFTITKNAVLNTIRSQKYKAIYLNHQLTFPSKNILLDEELNFKELEKAYDSVVDSLSPRKKEVFRLSRVELLSYSEISAKLGISVKTVENQMSSALAEIRMKISSLGFAGILFLFLFK
jgi:RNA polymerase sigma-70 factor (ECF subfamily)